MNRLMKIGAVFSMCFVSTMVFGSERTNKRCSFYESCSAILPYNGR